MVDDLLGVAKCGHESLALNTFINTQIELKKLQFHTTDKNGKSKCNVMHVGKPSAVCPQLKVHGTNMHTISKSTYLGDIVSADSKNDLNIQSRVAKGIGNITRVMNILDKVTLGSHYFKTALLLRESLFLSALLTNAESWHGITASQINQLESIDKLLLRKILKTPISTPTEAMYLELGIPRIGTIIKARRINFLHYILNRKESEMISQVFKVQWNQPSKNDWALLVKQDLVDLEIDMNLSNIKTKSEWSFKNFVKKKAYEYEFKQLIRRKETHTKLDNLWYPRLEMQNYLKLDNLNNSQAQTLFRYRVRMAKFGENFREKKISVECPLCFKHRDSQQMSFENCSVLKKNVKISGNYQQIFNSSVPTDTVKSLVQIDKFRDENCETLSHNVGPTAPDNTPIILGASDNDHLLSSELLIK